MGVAGLTSIFNPDVSDLGAVRAMPAERANSVLKKQLTNYKYYSEMTMFSYTSAWPT